ncbi:MAG TPA: hypothetical protein VK817_05465 [Trebonia sp.]|jgi:hypothetical protein|nr:hypothetical protein [Trebonia sp.]
MPRDPEVPQPQAGEPAPLIPAPPRPEQSFEDTDAAWGEYREPDDDERLNRDRPPHWDDF